MDKEDTFSVVYNNFAVLQRAQSEKYGIPGSHLYWNKIQMDVK